MIAIILSIVAYLLICIMAIPAILFGTIMSIEKNELNAYFMNIAVSLDQFGNTICKYLFNAVLIKKNGYQFGNVDETISSVLGKNYVNKTCTIIGLFFCTLLGKLDKNHVEKSIDETIK
jgi:hypothetical protein